MVRNGICNKSLQMAENNTCLIGNAFFLISLNGYTSLSVISNYHLLKLHKMNVNVRK